MIHAGLACNLVQHKTVLKISIQVWSRIKYEIIFILINLIILNLLHVGKSRIACILCIYFPAYLISQLMKNSPLSASLTATGPAPILLSTRKDRSVERRLMRTSAIRTNCALHVQRMRSHEVRWTEMKFDDASKLAEVTETRRSSDRSRTSLVIGWQQRQLSRQTGNVILMVTAEIASTPIKNKIICFRNWHCNHVYCHGG